MSTDARNAGEGLSVNGVREVKSAARTVELLEILASRGNRPARLRELVEIMDIPRSSLYALLRTLVKRGWVSSDSSGAQYRIGIRALLTGTSYLDTDPYLRVVRPCLDELGEDLDETFHFARLDEYDIVYLATRESTQYVRAHSRLGRRLPAHATSLGKAILAERSGQERTTHIPAALERLTPHTITTRKALEADLRRTAERGYARDEQENTTGLRCFAFPLRYSAPVQDALSVSVPVARLDPAREEQLVAALRRVRDRIERLMLAIGTDQW